MQVVGKAQRRLNPRSHNNKRSHVGIRKREEFYGDLEDDYHMAISLYDKARIKKFKVLRTIFS